MERKDHIDAFGAAALTLFSALLGFNQVVIAVVNEGLQPVFFAGLRSAGGVLCLILWFRLRNRPLGLERRHLGPGFLIGAAFALEFTCLFWALDLTSVARVSVIFYTMPLWLALMTHIAIPGEHLTPLKIAGQALAFSGVVLAILWRGGGAGEGSLLGDLLALVGALSWAAIALIARTSLAGVAPDRQLFWQLSVSAPLMLIAALFFGPFIRDLAPIHFAGLAFQVVIIVTLGFAFWFWLLTIYPAASVAAFSFLAPIFGVLFGWLLLGEQLGAPILAALVLVCLGLILISRPAQVPQKV